MKWFVQIVLMVGAGAVGSAAYAWMRPAAPERSDRARNTAERPQESGDSEAWVRRIERLERSLANARTAGGASKTTATPKPPPQRPPTDDTASAPQELGTLPAFVKRLRVDLGEGFGHAAASRLMGHLGTHHDEIADAVALLKTWIAKDPTNADLHCALATAYEAQTAYATPRGPQQGVVWEKAAAAYRRAIELDTNHWQARYGKAFGESMAPEFVGMRPAAIEQFEKLMEIQEAGRAEESHALVYQRLGTLYKDAGNLKRGRAVWARGLERFPKNKALLEIKAISGEDD